MSFYAKYSKKNLKSKLKKGVGFYIVIRHYITLQYSSFSLLYSTLR